MVTIGAVVVIVIALVLVALFLAKPAVEEEATEGTFEPGGTVISPAGETEKGGDYQVTITGTGEKVILGQTSPEINAKQVARIFVERFSTYSNQNNNEHLTDVLPLVTASMAKWIKSQDLDYASDYLSVTTQVITEEVEMIETDQAVILIGVIQTTETAQGVSAKNIDGRVNLIREGGEWKVDGLYWDK